MLHRFDSWWTRLVHSCVIVGICAGPSALFATGTANRAAAAVVAAFTVTLATIGGAPRAQRLLRNSLAIKALGAAIGVRIIPFVWIGDVMVGMTLVGFVGHGLSAPGKLNVVQTLLVTTLQGAYVATTYFIFAAVSFALIRKPKPPDGFCLKCGYDLRASPSRCPECGEAVTNDPLVSRINEPGDVE